MTKTTDIDDIIAVRDRDLMLDILWDDAAVVGKIRSKLDKVSAANLKHYTAHFCGKPVEEK